MAVHRQQGEQGEYELVLGSGRSIEIGSAANLLSVAKVRERIFDETGQLIPMDKREWPHVAKALRDMAIDVGRSATERLSDWLADYLEHENADRRIPETTQRGTPDWWRMVIKNMLYAMPIDRGGSGVVRDEQGRIWVQPVLFTQFVNAKGYHSRITESQMRKMLSRARFEPGQKAQRDEDTGKTQSVRLWCSPKAWR